jgi:hypothetical protein
MAIARPVLSRSVQFKPLPEAARPRLRKTVKHATLTGGSFRQKEPTVRYNRYQRPGAIDNMPC